MSWFNYYGLIIVAILMVPNIIYFALKKEEMTNQVKVNKILEFMEQVGRYGSFIFMVFNIPYVYSNFWFNHALITYLSCDFSLLVIYLLTWVVLWNKPTLLRTLILSIIPSLVFVLSGIILGNYLLIGFSVIFSICHIWISVRNVLGNNSYPSTNS